MPIQYEVDRDKRLLITHATGNLSPDDLFSYLDRLIADPEAEDCDELYVFQNVDLSEVSAADVRTLARRATELSRPEGFRVAFVAPRDADFGLVRAWKGDRHGNLVYRDSARNFNPLAAMCGRVTIAEVEHLVEPGEIDPNNVHTPGVFVQRVVPLTPEQAADKRIEKRTTRGAPPPVDPPKAPAQEGGL